MSDEEHDPDWKILGEIIVSGLILLYLRKRLDATISAFTAEQYPVQPDALIQIKWTLLQIGLHIIQKTLL